MKQLDPEDVVRRQRHQLQRRKYFSKGPNYVWHLEGYGKLKPFSFAIHACIDGYSRKGLWLSLLQSNKDPKLVCHLFTDFFRSLGGVPRKIVGDGGTEMFILLLPNVFYVETTPIRSLDLKLFSMAAQLVIKE